MHRPPPGAIRQLVLALPIAIALALLTIGAALANGLVVNITNERTTLRPGDTAIYTMTVDNTDPLSASHDILITSTLSATAAQVVTASDAGVDSGGVVSWPPVMVPATSTLTRTSVVNTQPPLPASTTALTVAAFIQDSAIVSSAQDVDSIGGAVIGGQVLHDLNRYGAACRR